MTTRRATQHGAGAPAKAQAKVTPARAIAFVLVAVVIIGGGAYLAGRVFLGQRGTTTVAEAIPTRISMEGFDPKVITAKPGQTVTLDWWNTDGAMHLQGGVHTMVSESLGIRLELPAESRKTVTITAPSSAGDYDFWCDSCCGGRDSPTMHGTLRVEA